MLERDLEDHLAQKPTQMQENAIPKSPVLPPLENLQTRRFWQVVTIL